jgi:hypothetical protein
VIFFPAAYVSPTAKPPPLGQPELNSGEWQTMNTDVKFKAFPSPVF